MLINHKDMTNYWCPMARVGAENMGTMNRHFSRRDGTDKVAPASCYCLGNMCMAWRWQDKEKGVGYCGLAGESQ